MAGTGGGSSSDLKFDLLKEGHAFSLFQVMRLLRSFGSPSSESEQSAESGEAEHIRIRPKLSLAFPPADVDRIEEINDEEPHFLVTATPLGLYGASSPLPTFYTEDLMDEAAADKSVSREFVDIFNHRLFLLLFKAWTKYRQLLQVVEEKNEEHFVKLFSLLGIGETPLREDVPGAYGLLRYMGLFTQFPRSAVGLRTLLQDAFGEIRVSVLPCIDRMAAIPEDQILFLGTSGCTLGEDSFVGQEIEDRMGKFRLKVGPLKRDQFQALLPGTEGCAKLAFLTKFYVVDSLEYDLVVTLAEREAKSACLGASEWSRLGLDTWIFAGDQIGEVSATFCPEQ
ncbi:MAG: type VI secretion system baseplate subunit TssG [Proteobacteria bacterium]|nr:type VI secretion system baseplate subunit TssG [Pseudomonadota bacterium]